MTCHCIAKIDEMFAPLNGRLGTRFTGDDSGMKQTAILVVDKVNPRGKKPPGLLAKFCPVCGTAYDAPVKEDKAETSGKNFPEEGMSFPSHGNIREQALEEFSTVAAGINDSDSLMSVFAAPEWAELSEDGQQWVCALVRETLARQRDGTLCQKVGETSHAG
jgi:hypothetical protein